MLQHRNQAKFRDEHQSLQQQILTLRSDNGRISNLLSQAINVPDPQSDSSAELLRLRSEVGALRHQTNALASLLAKTGDGLHPTPASDPDQVLAILPEDYPQTPQAAAQLILDFLSRGDPDQFFAYFGHPGAKKMYDNIFADEKSKKLIGMTVISIGESTTNAAIPGILMVPYKVRLRDGTERELQLRLVQDRDTRRWYFKGGL